MAWSEAARKAALEARRRNKTQMGRLHNFFARGAKQKTALSVDEKQLLQKAPYGKAGQRVPGVKNVTFGMKSKAGKQYFSAKSKKGVLRTGFATLAQARAWAGS
jgi:hypothetical protein